MSGNIRVVCRFRPQNSKEIKANGKVVIDFLDAQTVHLNVRINNMSKINLKKETHMINIIKYRAVKQIINLHLIQYLYQQIHKKKFMMQQHYL